MDTNNLPPNSSPTHWEVARAYENRVVETTLQLLDNGQMGERAPRILRALDTALLSLVEIASCAYGCRSSLHIAENIVRRFLNGALASLRLASAGYYDEALVLLRTMSEWLNLLQLFSVNLLELRDWAVLGEKDRMQRFSPFQVRLKIEDGGKRPLMDKDAYGKLCEMATHATPAAAFVCHDPDQQRVFVGPNLSVPPFLLILNELGYLVGNCLPLAASLTWQDQEQVEKLRDVQHALFSTMSDLRVSNYEQRLGECSASAEPDGVVT